MMLHKSVNPRKLKRRLKLFCFLFSLLLWTLFPVLGYSQETIPDAVLDIFDNSCAFRGCHAGSNAPKGLDLSEDFALAALVNEPSREKRGVMRVKPGDPLNSYLIMKLKGDSSIEGNRMPKKGRPLNAQEIATIENWIVSLPPGLHVQAPQREYLQAFPGMTLSTLPTTETIEKGFFSYRIAHRWRGEVVDGGFANLFGLDEGARMLTQLSFAVTDQGMLYVARTSENATFEFAGKWRFLRQKSDGSMPISAAVKAGFDWETRKELSGLTKILSRSDGERFHWFAQVPLSKQFGQRISVLLVPGILLNGNVAVSDENPIFTLGFGGKLMLFEGFSLFVEGVPILSGDDDAATVGGPRIEADGDRVVNDSFTIGLERKIGGHVFHVYITNSLGLTTNQYMSGGNMDFLNGDFRLGFNIYRMLRLPF
ncbi:MAG: DUF5777 family beta-barrel protein [bacterium]